MTFERSEKNWKLGFATGYGQKPRERGITARHQERALQKVARGKKRSGLPESAPVVGCYETGRDGFWLRRDLETLKQERASTDDSYQGVAQ